MMNVLEIASTLYHMGLFSILHSYAIHPYKTPDSKARTLLLLSGLTLKQEVSSPTCVSAVTAAVANPGWVWARVGFPPALLGFTSVLQEIRAFS